MKLVPRLLLGALALVVIAAVVGVAIFERIPPSKYGVKQNLWGGGVEEGYAETGLRIGITGLHDWHLLDRRTHFLTFSRSNEGRMSSSARPSLEIRTKDNNTASVDVTVTYRIIPEEAHLIVAEGLEFQYPGLVRERVKGLLREQLAQLSPEDFVDSDTRMERADATFPLLETELAKIHVQPESILIRAVRFPPEFEKKLQQQQLTRQLAPLADANERVEKQLKETGVIEKDTEAREKEARAEWNKRLQTQRSDNEVEIARILAEAQVYERTTRSESDAGYVKLVAEGDLSLAQAEALRDELRNRALDTLGGRILLAAEAARNLDVERVVLNSNDPAVPTILDVDALVDLLVGGE
jgi:regulator of protease activity HflC (stomatin/prohibitin superfamily)